MSGERQRIGFMPDASSIAGTGNISSGTETAASSATWLAGYQNKANNVNNVSMGTGQ